MKTPRKDVHISIRFTEEEARILSVIAGNQGIHTAVMLRNIIRHTLRPMSEEVKAQGVIPPSPQPEKSEVPEQSVPPPSKPWRFPFLFGDKVGGK